ncbi:hypothetical protein [Fusobacterium sp.]|uniref:hypothetical protein n=1 Tax=Fusobacterium sp. TaxID=68766 RepID=UPI002620EAD6|nr:hypothetical protein [Fusobacterium sp.]
MEKLLELGLKKVGSWKKSEKVLSFEISDFKDSTDTIFAFVQNSTVVYMATTTENFETFLNTFINPSSIDLEKIGIKNLLLKNLDNGDISIYALKNKKFFGFMTKFSPVKIASIIKEINPSWNSDDLKDRMKNIVGKDRNAVLKSEKLKKELEVANENKNSSDENVTVPTKEKTKKQHETYIFILGKSYYDRGFFNLKTSYSHLVGEDKTDIQIVLEGKEKYTISGKINRTANTSKAARIIGNKALKIWFQENSKVNGEIRITFISKKKIKLEVA